MSQWAIEGLPHDKGHLWVSASSFATNISVKWWFLSLLSTSCSSNKKFILCRDDCLTGTDTVQDAIELQEQLQELLLSKWNTSKPTVLLVSYEIQPDWWCTNWLRNWQKKLNRPTPRNRSSDQFRLTVSELLTSDYLTKRLLVSDIAKTFDVLGWFSPSIIKTKLLLQRCWEQKLNWDDPVSSAMYDAWYNWRSSLRKNVFTLLLWHISSNHLFWTLRVSVMHQNMPSLPTDDWPLRKCWGHSDNIKYQGSSDKAIDDTSSWIMWTITYWLIYFTTRVKYLKFHLPMFAHGQIALLCTTGWMEALGVSSALKEVALSGRRLLTRGWSFLRSFCTWMKQIRKPELWDSRIPTT